VLETKAVRGGSHTKPTPLLAALVVALSVDESLKIHATPGGKKRDGARRRVPGREKFSPIYSFRA
jgi:hypothetical protein